MKCASSFRFFLHGCRCQKIRAEKNGKKIGTYASSIEDAHLIQINMPFFTKKSASGNFNIFSYFCERIWIFVYVVGSYFHDITSFRKLEIGKFPFLSSYCVLDCRLPGLHEEAGLHHGSHLGLSAQRGRRLHLPLPSQRAEDTQAKETPGNVCRQTFFILSTFMRILIRIQILG